MITFAAQIKYGHLKTDSGWTYGGYSASQTVHQKFIVKVFLKPFLFCSLKNVSGARWIPLGGCGTRLLCWDHNVGIPWNLYHHICQC